METDSHSQGVPGAGAVISKGHLFLVGPVFHPRNSRLIHLAVILGTSCVPGAVLGTRDPADRKPRCHRAGVQIGKEAGRRRSGRTSSLLSRRFCLPSSPAPQQRVRHLPRKPTGHCVGLYGTPSVEMPISVCRKPRHWEGWERGARQDTCLATGDSFPRRGLHF